MIKKLLLFFLCLSLFLSISDCKKKLPTTPDIPTKILPTIEYFTATPESISPGESSVLSWSVKNATNVTIDQGVGTVSAKDTKEVTPEETTTYTLTATNSDGQKTKSCTIEVGISVQSIVVISSSDMLYIGVSETFTAVATMSDGSSKAVVGGVWSGDNSSIAAVETGTGLVTIVGSGMVNVSVSYEGKQGSKAIRGLPNYQGTWSGSYVITGCDAIGHFLLLEFCSLPEAQIGVPLPIELSVTQDEDRVEGRFLLGHLGADGGGPIGIDGQLLLTGAVQFGTITVEVVMLLQSATPGEITGELRQLWLMTGFEGNGQLEASIQELNRISTMATALTPSTPLMRGSTLEDLIRALIRR